MWRPTLACLAVLYLAQPTYAASCNEPGSLVRARTSAQGKFEFAVFSFRKPTSLIYEVQSATPPFTEDPSGNPVAVNGSKFTEIVFRNVNWMCEITETLQLPRQAIIDVKRTGQFEGIVSYVIGRSAGSRFIKVYSYDTASGYRVVVVKFRR